MALHIGRKIGEQVVIDGGITITVTDIGRGRVLLSIDAPPATTIFRGELPNNQRDDMRSKRQDRQQ